MASDDRAMLLTAPGNAAIAVIRIAGSGVDAFLAEHLDRDCPTGRCVHAMLRDESGQTIDDPVIVRSATARHAIDINLHGGAWVIQSTLALLRRRGFTVLEPATPEALTLYDGRSLLNRELQAALSHALTDAAIRLLCDQRRAWEGLATNPPQAPDVLASVLADQSLWRSLHPPAVAIVGQANVGKSTLANQLFQRTRSITADLPGTTRDWVEAPAEIGGLAVQLLDLPGLRASDDPIEQAAIRTSIDAIQNVDLLLHVVDATEGPSSEPLSPAIGKLVDRGTPILRVINKVDRLVDPQAAPPGAIAISALTGTGLQGLGSSILATLRCTALRSEVTRPCWWTSRQEAILHRAVGGMISSSQAIEEIIGDDRNLQGGALR